MSTVRPPTCVALYTVISLFLLKKFRIKNHFSFKFYSSDSFSVSKRKSFKAMNYDIWWPAHLYFTLFTSLIRFELRNSTYGQKKLSLEKFLPMEFFCKFLKIYCNSANVNSAAIAIVVWFLLVKHKVLKNDLRFEIFWLQAYM